MKGWKSHALEHQDLQDKFADLKSGMKTLHYINNLSEKQKPVFEDLEKDVYAFEKLFREHVHSTSWVSPVQFVVKFLLWIGSLGAIIGVLKAIGII